VWCSISSRGMLGSLFFEATITGTVYLTMLKDDKTRCFNILFSDEDCHFQHDGSPPHYHTFTCEMLWNALRMPQNQEHCRTWSTKMKWPVLLFHRQQ
jgi:hypothetical protein